MHSSKLIEIFKTLSQKELKQFSDFVQSPFFNKHQKLRELTDILCEAAPAFAGEKISKQHIFAQLFPKEKYAEQKISDLMSYLVRLLEEFFAYLHYSGKITLQQLHLLTEMRKRDLDKQFQSAVKEVRKSQEQEPFRNNSFFYNEFLLQNENDLFFEKQEKRAADQSLQLKSDNLDVFYLATKLKDCCEMLNRKNVVAADYQLHLLDELLEYLKKNLQRYGHIPAITIYFQILMTLLESEKEEHFVKLKKLLAENAHLFPQDEARVMYDFAKNYCIKKINSGNSQYLKEIFDLYQTLLNNGIIFQGKSITQWDYKNIVSTALRLKEFDWTEKFINDYKTKIDLQFRENAFVYNLASLYYEKEEYEKAMRLLQSVEFTDISYHLGAKSMLLKIYYELDEGESLLSLLDAFKIYLRRNKLVSDYQMKIHINLIKFSKKAFNMKSKRKLYKSSVSKKEMERFKNKIKTTKEVANLKWLMQKVDELGAL